MLRFTTRELGNLATCLFLLVSCAKSPMPAPATTTTPAPTTTAAVTSGPRITLPDGLVVRIEVAADDETRSFGLMYRDRMPEGTGMLFVFPRTDEYSFWMKNTIIPLDMVWIDETRKVVHVKSDVPPCKADPCPSYPPGVKSRYVLELAAGQAKKHGIAAGTTLKFESLDNLVVR